MTTVVLVQQGGTGSNNAADARSALGAAPSAAYDQANAAYAQANTAASSANNALPLTGGTVTGQLNITGTGLALNVANNVFFGSNVAIGAQVENFPLYVERDSLGVTSVFITEDGTLNPRVVIYGNNQGSVIQHTYSANASNLLFSIGGSIGDGVEAMRIAENRNIGLGETNPTAKLHVNGSAIFSQDVTITGNIYLQGNTTYINVATLNVNDPLIYLASNNELSDTVDIGFMGGKNTSGVYSHTGLARDASDGKYKLFDGLPEEDHVGNVINFANTYLATLVANVEANTLSVVNGVSGNVNFDSGTMFVDSVGNKVGIGTSSPATKLHVSAGAIRLDNGYSFTWAGTGGWNGSTTGSQFFKFTDNNQYYDVYDGSHIFRRSGYANSMVIDSTGNVQISASGTEERFLRVGSGRAGNGYSYIDIVGDATYGNGLRLIRVNTGPNAASSIEHRGTGSLQFVTQEAGNIDYYTNGANFRMRIASDGNVGIGTSSPAYTLDVNSTSGIRVAVATGGYNWLNLLSGYTGNLSIGFNDNGGSGGLIINQYNSSGSFVRSALALSSAGGFSVGTTANPGAGAIYATGDITAFYSDDRLKTKLGNIDSALSKVLSLNGFYFEPNETAMNLGYEKKKQVGVSAQEVQAVLPEVVVPAPIDQEYMTVHYHKIVPLLIEAIKELNEKIEKLTK